MSNATATVAARRRNRDEPPMSLTTYLLHGAGWLTFMLFLFWLAGLKF
ncbi:MAG: hypothetical protein K2X11_02690 [Acetobacteraceae bacterium]|nr:hypothetical protein [Acetobacteraceae bacterium]